MSYTSFGTDPMPVTVPVPQIGGTTISLPTFDSMTMTKSGIAMVRPESIDALYGALNLYSYAPDGPEDAGTETGSTAFVPFSGQSASSYIKDKMAAGYIAMIQKTSVIQPPRLTFSKVPQFVASVAVPGAGYAVIDGPPDMIAQTQNLASGGKAPTPGTPGACAPGQIGIPPNCVTPTLPIGILKCPDGTTGIFPSCTPVPPSPTPPPVAPVQQSFMGDYGLIALGLGGAAVLAIALFGGKKGYARNRRQKPLFTEGQSIGGRTWLVYGPWAERAHVKLRKKSKSKSKRK
jgi:hypothetical protein